MSKASSVVNAAYMGIKARSFHPHFAEVNPLNPQGSAYEDRNRFNERCREVERKLRQRRKTGRILKSTI